MEVNYDCLRDKNIADFLILTVTDIETEELVKLLQPISKQGTLSVNVHDRNYVVGKLGQYNVIHRKCPNMGTQEVGSSTLVTKNALEDWPCIKAVFMVGIAFGMYNEDNNQHFSDVLVSNKVYPYENQKCKSDGSIIYRGTWHNADERLINAFREIADNWTFCNLTEEKVRIEICPLLSGEKLVDDLEYRNKLKESFIEARGGEMEGIGLASACEDMNKPWILIKAICDFADGNKADNKDEKQHNAAMSAGSALLTVLHRPDLLKTLHQGNCSDFFYFEQTAPEIVDMVLFETYSSENEPYYHLRDVDETILNSTKVKGCWVYGKSGVGKTIALQRALGNLNVDYLLIDLSTFVGKPIEEMFKYVYEEVCLKFDEEPNFELEGLHRYSKEIGKIVEKNIVSGDFYIMIEEIPLCSDTNMSEFQAFVQQLCAVVISNNIFPRKVRTKFILSSIASPVEFINAAQQKIETRLRFIEMPEWTIEDCKHLIELITPMIQFEFGDIDENDFIMRMEKSPRKIKEVFKDLLLLEKRVINEKTLSLL